MGIQLNFINNSNDQNASQVVIFQSNVLDASAPVAPSQVITSVPGEQYPFALQDQGAIDANIYKDGKLLAAKTGLGPHHVVIGAIPAGGLKEGANLTAAILGNAKTELDLTGITSANIVMTGGGDQPLQFALQHPHEVSE